MIDKLTIDSKSKNYLVVSSDIKLRYELVMNKICQYLEISEKKIIECPDVKYVSLPIIDKSGNIISVLSNKELLMREYGLIDNIDSNRIGNEITIDQIREIISFTQISAHKSKKIVILNAASYMNKEASSALLKTLEEVSSNCSFILLTSSSNNIGETIKSRCQVLSYEGDVSVTNDTSFENFFFNKHPFLKEFDMEFSIADLIKNICTATDGLLEKTLDPIDVSNDWSKFHVNLILYILNEYIIFNCKKVIDMSPEYSSDHYPKKLIDIYCMLPHIRHNLNLNINTKYLLNNLAIELAS
tara:strand:+ start:2572 stop:3471 length:900 start_codon:yes stop_codon:yes gene_type:complete